VEISNLLQELADHGAEELPAHDLQEPFRWIADVAVMESFESGVLDLPDFYFTGDDYRYRFDPEAKQRFLDLLRERFNSAVSYRGRSLKWDTVIEHKTLEFAQYLAGRNGRFDFSDPAPRLDSVDSRGLQEAILSLSQAEARERGIGKSTFHYLQKNARSGRSFRTYSRVLSKLQHRE
jgi:CRISPR-associated protein Cas1